MKTEGRGRRIAIVGGGPSGLIAAQVLAQAQKGLQIDVFDAMPSVGRKFLLAGRGGLNLTHAEPLDQFIARYRNRSPEVAAWLDVFGPQDLRDWAADLGVETFIGSSQRVFPKEMKASPLLRAWLRRLDALGVRTHAGHQWMGWQCTGPVSDQILRFSTPQGETQVQADATILALGGGSWKRLGSDGAWIPSLAEHGVEIAPLVPANCGFDHVRPWSEHLRTRFAGQPVKSVILSFEAFRRQGEFVLTDTGFEGSLIYAASADIRDAIARDGAATISLDLLPAKSEAQIQGELQGRGSRSLGAVLKSKLNLHGLKAALLYELLPKTTLADPVALAQSMKALPVTFTAPRPLDEAISSAGGVRFASLTAGLELKSRSGVYCVGEMLDWEAPTGGYLLTACLASGVVAAQAVLRALLDG